MMSQQGPQQITVQADQRLRPDLPAGMWAQIMQIVQTAPVSWQTANPLVQALGEALQKETEGGGMLPNGLDTSPSHLTQ